MRCNWLTTRRTDFRSIIQRCKTPRRILLGRPIAHHGQLTSHFSNAALQPAIIEPPVLECHASGSPLTAAQMSRVGCHAVHLSVSNPIGGVEDAYFIVNSLRYSSMDPGVLGRQGQLVKEFESAAIQFGQPVPSRLASHALLHDLIRIGHKSDASRLASQMMANGMTLRRKTLESIMKALVLRPRSSSLKSSGPFHFIPNRSIDNLIPTTQNYNTQLALELVSAAGKSQNQRTRGMFATLICICLFNGELILASLIFGFVVNEYQLRMTLKSHFDSVPAEETIGPAPDRRAASSSAWARYQSLRREDIYPSQTSMYEMLSSIEKVLGSDGEVEERNVSRKSGLQALANLAVLLDHRQLPFKSLGPLIRMLYKCSRTDEEVWITDKHGQPKQVNAYLYFHDVLHRLSDSLPARNPRLQIQMNAPPLASDELKDTVDVLPRLDLHSYNSLLHYALRHRLSAEHGDKILTHMLTERQPPVKPDIATYNILLRAGALLRRKEFTHEALRAMHVHFGENKSPRKTQSTVEPVLESVPAISRGSSTALRAMPDKEDDSDHFLFQLDPYSLSTYLTYATSGGRPQLIKDLVHKIFPEIRPIPYSSQAVMSRDQLHLTYKDSRESCLKRAVDYGPYVFAAMLNALCKSGQPGLAKSVWRLARDAERKSWESDFAPDVKAWCLPVHAYTSMIQCYVLEAKNPKMNPRSCKISKAWAVERARARGISVYRLMKRRAKQLQRLIRLAPVGKVHPRNAIVPQPDARLFNTMLELFASQKRPRKVRRKMAHYRRRFRRAQRQFAQKGERSRYWHPKLREVGRGMRKYGFAIPPAMRHLFLGRWRAGTWHYDTPPHLEPRPFAYPSPTLSFTPFTVPTTKNRGLPLRRRRDPPRR